MKLSYIGIVAIVLVMIAVVFAGCTSQTTTSSASAGSTPTASSGSSSSASSSPAASSSQQVGSTVSSTSVFGTSYSWVEYQTTTTGQGNEISMDIKSERSTSTYNGQPAIEMKATMTSSQGTSTVSDIYYDSAMSSVLGGTMTMTVNGQTTTMNIPASQLNQASATNFNKARSLTFEGIEPVSVPAGTYPAASKYSSTDNGSTMTFWSAPGVPVPVQMTVATSSGGSVKSELVGWG